MYKDKDKQREVNRRHAREYRERKGMTKGEGMTHHTRVVIPEAMPIRSRDADLDSRGVVMFPEKMGKLYESERKHITKVVMEGRLPKVVCDRTCWCR